MTPIVLECFDTVGVHSHWKMVDPETGEILAIEKLEPDSYSPLTGKELVLQQIDAERNRQDVKWGKQSHDPTEWLSILGEEFGEVCKAVCEAHFTNYYSTGNWENYREELIHTAAVAVAMIENLDNEGSPYFHDEVVNLRSQVKKQKELLARSKELLEKFSKFDQAMSYMGGDFPKTGNVYGVNAGFSHGANLTREDFAQATKVFNDIGEVK